MRRTVASGKYCRPQEGSIETVFICMFTQLALWLWLKAEDWEQNLLVAVAVVVTVASYSLPLLWTVELLLLLLSLLYSTRGRHGLGRREADAGKRGPRVFTLLL